MPAKITGYTVSQDIWNTYARYIYMFRAIWEFAQSQDCVAHSQNPPEVAFQSSSVSTVVCMRNLCNLKIAHNSCAISRSRNYNAQSRDWKQSQVSENAQRNLEIAQIPRLRGTYNYTHI